LDAVQRELQFLKQRARPLADHLPDWRERRVWTVSDFWLDQSLAHADVLAGDDDLAAVRRAWAELSPTLVPAKLLVLCNPKNHPLAQTIGGLARGRVPVLALSSAAVDSAVEEVLAAVDAMQ
jgi:hypothetical protein